MDLCTSIDVGRIHRIRRTIMSLFYLPTLTPLTLPNYYSKELQEKVELRLRQESFDLIFIYCSSMAPYVLDRERIPKVIDFVDVDSEKWFEYARSTLFPISLIYFREGYLLRRYEKQIAEFCRHAFVTSRREKIAFEKFLKGAPVTTVCNGVAIPENAKVRRSGCRMMFTGVMDYWPNEDAVCHFVHDIFPLITERVPEAEFFIVGQRPTRKVRDLSKVQGVTVTGWVPDPGSYLDEAVVFVAPIRIARGIQNKVLEAMACGVPVISTNAAADGLDSVNGRDFLLADSPVSFAEQAVLLLRDGGFRERLAASAIEYVRKNHDWNSNLKEMENIMAGIADLK